MAIVNILKIEDLPAPLGPNTPIISFLAMLNDTLFTLSSLYVLS